MLPDLSVTLVLNRHKRIDIQIHVRQQRRHNHAQGNKADPNSLKMRTRPMDADNATKAGLLGKAQCAFCGVGIRSHASNPETKEKK